MNSHLSREMPNDQLLCSALGELSFPVLKNKTKQKANKKALSTIEALPEYGKCLLNKGTLHSVF